MNTTIKFSSFRSNFYLTIIAIISLSLLPSCEKEIPENPDFDTQKAVASLVEINVSEVGGNDLHLVSFFDEKSAMINDKFNTVVSKLGVQLLFVTDGSNKLRALTLSTPSASGVDILKIDAMSTAISFVYLTIGILTTDGQEGLSVIQKIKNLASFMPLKTYLINNLSTYSLDGLIKNPDCTSLIKACIEEYISTQNSPKGNSLKGINEENNRFIFSPRNAGTEIELTNSAYRCVTIAQRDINSLNSEIKVDSLLTMGGAIPVSWGSMIRALFNSGSGAYDPTNETVGYSPSTDVSYSEFWIIGPGAKPSSVLPPNSVDLIEQPWAETIAYYLIGPLIDIASGSTDFLKKTKNIIELRKLLDNAEVMLDLTELYYAAADGDREALTNYIMDQILSSIGPLCTALGYTEAGKWIAVLSAGIGGWNIGWFVGELFTIEPYSLYTMGAYTNPPSVPILKSPENNTVNINKPYMLFWNSCPNALSYDLQISKDLTFNPVLINQSAVTSGAIVENIDNNTKYFWRVRAKNNIGTSAWSEIWNFTTSNNAQTALFSNENYDLNNNQVPPAWEFFETNEEVVLKDGHLVATPVDAYGGLRRKGTMPVGTNQIKFEWDGNLAYTFWGMLNILKINYSGNKAFQVYLETAQVWSSTSNYLFLQYNDGTGNQIEKKKYTVPLQHGEFHYTVTVSSNQIDFKCKKQGDSQYYVDQLIPIPSEIGFSLQSINSYEYITYTTTDNVNWLDNISVTIN